MEEKKQAQSAGGSTDKGKEAQSAGGGPRRAKPRIREAIVVEGRYDKNTLAQVVDAPIVTLEGFAVFHDREKLEFLRRLAEARGLILLTDSDGAGFVLRRYLKGALPGDQVRHAYIPDWPGKERRKRTASKEGKLGVEGMRPEILLDCLRRAGATFLEPSPRTEKLSPHTEKLSPHTEKLSPRTEKLSPRTEKLSPHTESVSTKLSPLLRGDTGGYEVRGDAEEAAAPITKADLYAWGLSGGEGSAERRRNLLRKLSLPEKLGSNAMLEALNLLFDRQSLIAWIEETEEKPPQA